MKRITRKYTERNVSVQQQVWLDESGHWTHDKNAAHAFQDAEAQNRVRRIPHAELEEVTNEEEH